MYAQRFNDGPRFRPGSMAAAIAINGGVLAALLFAAPQILPDLPKPRIPIFEVEPTPTPTPEPQQTAERRKPTTQPTTAATTTPTKPEQPDTSIDRGLPPLGGGGGSTGGTDTGPRGDPGPPLILPLVGASFDPRYAGDQEPPYPDTLRDAGVEGVVKLRLTIGADGRVKQAIPLSGDARLVRIAVRHVLAKWRFRPATRGAVPEESTQVMTVRFRLDS